MNPEEQIRSALRALAEHDRDLEAGTLVEARVLRGFRQSRQQRVMRMVRRVGIWPVGIAAAIALVFLVAGTRQSVGPVSYRVEPIEAQPFEVVAPPPVQELVKAQATVRAPRREIVTEFYVLTDSALPLERGRLLRVKVPASMMYSVGLPINPDRWSDRVDADVVVGEEGMARAIRFVGYEQ